MNKTSKKTNKLIGDMLGFDKNVPKSNSRSKRSIFSFVGDIAKGLFDVATEKDINSLSQHINKIYNMNKETYAKFVSLVDNLESFSGTVNKKIYNVVKQTKGMNENIRKIGRALNNIDLNSVSMQKAIVSLIPSILDRMHQTIILENRLELFILGYNSLLERKLSPLLIASDMLRKALSDVEKH